MKHERYKSRLLASSLLMTTYTNKDTLSLTFVMLIRKSSITYFGRYKK